MHALAAAAVLPTFECACCTKTTRDWLDIPQAPSGLGIPGNIEGTAHGEHISWRRGRRPRAARPCTAATPAPRMAMSAYFPGTARAETAPYYPEA